MEFEGKKYEYPPHEISIGHAEEEKEIKGRRGRGLVAQILKGKTQTKTGIFRAWSLNPTKPTTWGYFYNNKNKDVDQYSIPCS